MGRRFYEATVPKLVEDLARLNRTLTTLVEAVERAEDRDQEEGDEDER